MARQRTSKWQRVTLFFGVRGRIAAPCWQQSVPKSPLAAPGIISRLSSSAPQEIGPYTVNREIGRGGMGVVYLGHDTRLDRAVAIKALPVHLADDPDRLARFEREARTLASLNHPNVAGIYGVEEQDGQKYLILEYVEGQTLEERLDGGALPVDEAIEVAVEIASGVEAAHEAGVIHRDLKPGNIKLTPEGRVKVLDLGLARSVDSGSSSSSSLVSESPTITSPAQHSPTMPGAILGTAPYMSPEQARGRHVDKRTDIWSFGVILYEMLTGAGPFHGETATDSIGAILHKNVDMDQLPATTPTNVRRVLRRCLERDKAMRYRDIGDARLELVHGSLDVRSLSPDEQHSQRRFRVLGLVGWAVAAFVGVALLIIAMRPPAPPGDSTGVTRTTIALPDDQRQPRLLQSPLAITRDGSMLAYVARGGDGIIRLYLRPLDSYEHRVVPGSENARAPFFSPDGEWIGFFSNGGLRKSRVDGGQPFKLTSVSSLAFGASWGSDGTIVYAANITAGLWRISEDGGEPMQLTQPDFEQGGYAHVWPHHLPGGRHVIFSVWGGNHAGQILDLRTGTASIFRENVAAGGSRILPSGHLIHADVQGSGRLLSAPFDLESRELLGPAVPVLDDVRYFDSQSATPYLAVSDSGTAVYVSRAMGEATVQWVGRDGVTTPIRTGHEIIAGLRLSPDGRRAVFNDEQGGTWLLDLTRGTIDVATRADELFASYAIWHSNGQELIVSSNVDGSWNLYSIPLSGRSVPEKIMERPNNQYAASMSSDGRLLAYVENHPETALDVWIKPAQGEPHPVARTPADESQPAISPDGALIAYSSSENGRAQIYLQELDGAGRIDVSIDGGEQPLWARDGSELFFRRGDRLYSVEVSAEPSLTVSRPTEVFDLAIESGSGFGITPHFDVSADGTRFLVVTERPTTGFKVITNWFEELNRRVPTARNRTGVGR